MENGTETSTVALFIDSGPEYVIKIEVKLSASANGTFEEPGICKTEFHIY